MGTNDGLVSVETIRSLFTYDPEEGVLRWASARSGGVQPGDVVGAFTSKGYRRTRIGGINFRVHRLVWVYVHGEWPRHQIDHINGVRDDNRIANLRDVPCAINAQNVRNVTSGPMAGRLRGTWRMPSGCWRAKLTVQRKVVFRGTFATEQEAHEAYLAAKRIHHVGCAI